MIGNCYIVMWILIISLVLLGVIALIAGIIRNKRLQKKIEKGELDRMPEVKEVDVECCGQHEVCERDSLLAAVSKKIEYYDDEELDQFIGKAGDAYTEEETEMFRDVLYTTLDVEVAGWIRSLQLRGIELPDDLKDEVFLSLLRPIITIKANIWLRYLSVQMPLPISERITVTGSSIL